MCSESDSGGHYNRNGFSPLTPGGKRNAIKQMSTTFCCSSLFSSRKMEGNKAFEATLIASEVLFSWLVAF